MFTENLRRLARLDLSQAKRIEEADSSSLGFCTTEKNEPNLCKHADGKAAYYHSPQGALEEAKRLFEQYPPLGTDIQFIFGLGLGYFYEAWQPWLQEDPERLLIFLEDDPAVVRRFLETERAAGLLANPQVIIKAFHTPDDNQWGRFRQEFEWFFWACAMRTVSFLALPYYNESRFPLFEKIVNQIQMNLIDCNWFVSKLVVFHKLFANNWYHNIPWLAEAGYAPAMYGFFKQVPAIICGAGPSLTKQIPLLRALQDKAVLIGSGTAVNILNKHGIFPHAGLALDPYEVQESRFLTNYSWETPYFYANQFYSGAFAQLHGEKAFLLDESLNQIHEKEWIREVLNLPSSTPIPRGISTSNVALYLAGALGCNPIIFVGMDLAYTHSSRYAEGAGGHPTDDRSVQDSFYQIGKKLLPVKGLDGSEIFTKWDWVLEADCFADYALQHPDIKILNATEGGWPIDKIENITLKEAIGKYLQKSIDIQGMMHAAFQNSRIPSLTDARVEEALQAWKKSLEKCSALCTTLLQILTSLGEKIQKGLKVNSQEDASLTDLKKQLAAEEAYKSCLKERNGVFNKLYYREMRKLEGYPELYDEQNKSIILNEIEKHRYRFLKESIDMQLFDLIDGLAIHERYRQKMKHTAENTRDGLAEGFLAEEVSRDKIEELDENGIKKSVYSYKENVPDGIISHFSPHGALLSESRYEKGNKEGSSRLYYKSDASAQGAIYAELSYKNNVPHGVQRYYYPDGIKKTTLSFVHGVLDGAVELYYPNGNKKRVLHFRNGKLDGKEQKWNEDGTLILEAEYRQDIPCGTAKQWYENGQLAKEVRFYENPQNYDVFEWDMRGNLVQKKLYLPENPLGDVLSKSEQLHKNIEALTDRINQLQEQIEKKKEDHG